MNTVRLLTAAAVAALFAGSAAAQTTTTQTQSQTTTSASSSLSAPTGATLRHADAMTADAAEAAAKPTASESGANDGRLEVMTVASTGGMTVQVVANTPIPDSPTTRATFGGPDSRAGKRTPPAPGPVGN